MENSIEEDMKILEEFKTHGYAMLLIKYEDRNKTNLKLDQAIEHILQDYKRVLKENEELKILEDDIQDKRIVYIDTPEFKENYIPVQIIEDFIKEYQKLGDEFYEKFLETNRTDKDLHDAGLACDAKVDVLKKVLKEGKEFDKAAEEINKYCKNGGENNDKSNKK